MNKFALNRRVLIVGEGRETEYNYFVGFRNAFEKELADAETSVSVRRGRGGDARSIVENAIKEAKRFQRNRKRGDRVFLLLDTEGAGRAPELPEAENLAGENGIEIVYSSPAIEYWLLCHFPKIPRAYFNDCDSVVAQLDKNKRWNSVCKTQYDKADQDVFERLSHLLSEARAQALEIDLLHLRSKTVARAANPSTQVYELIAMLIGVRTGEKCPIAGEWELIGDTSEPCRLNKGEKMPPDQGGNEVIWRL